MTAAWPCPTIELYFPTRCRNKLALRTPSGPRCHASRHFVGCLLPGSTSCSPRRQPPTSRWGEGTPWPTNGRAVNEGLDDRRGSAFVPQRADRQDGTRGARPATTTPDFRVRAAMAATGSEGGERGGAAGEVSGLTPARTSVADDSRANARAGSRPNAPQPITRERSCRNGDRV